MINITLYVKKYVFLIVLLLIFDIIWLMINKNGYSNMVIKVQNTNLNMNITGAILSYICVFLSIVFFTLPMIEYQYETKNKLWLSLRYGGFLGFLIYGIFNFTNMAIFENYDIKMAIKDTLWGTFLFTIVPYIIISLYPN